MWVRSSELNIMYGVPKESVLGPLLFLIFDINELVMFADDNTVVQVDLRRTGAQKMTQRLANTFSLWFKQNLLFLNVSKTSFLSISSYNVIEESDSSL
ncbi:hypothetical protein WA026_010755 [Henosepilachna vigintioctopunctata]|uniref:Reverse transcriptase domain-containing protein n=1 Tax=Henosepilachna vigintioctopunctata TaxID=420089 RepID=A0AAW1UXL4_9CUCU